MFIHTCNLEGEVKKSVLLTIASKRMKYLEINLTKDMKDVYTENNKILLKEIRKDPSKWKHIACTCIGRQYFLDVCATQSDLQIQKIPYQDSNQIL